MAHRFLFPATLDVSFVIATFNRGTVLIDCLRRTLACGLDPARFEIIVVDNASTDGTAELLTALPEVTLIRLDKNAGPVAKNVAIARSRGRVIVLLDDDAYPLANAVTRMLGHMEADPTLGAAVFDVSLPDGTREASAYGAVFIGAGTALRRSALEKTGFLPPDYFMQAEEFDLSLRLWDAGYRVMRFADLPLRHLKSPQARIADRTTRLDVRNNLYLLAKYLPAPLCYTLAADWLHRYWLMAAGRDRAAGGLAHRNAFLRGSAEGMQAWSTIRRSARRVSAETVECVFAYEGLRERMAQAVKGIGLPSGQRPRIVFAELGKNMHAYFSAAVELQLDILAIADDNLCNTADAKAAYRGIPIISTAAALNLSADAWIITPMSSIHAERRVTALRGKYAGPLLNLVASDDQRPIFAD